MVTRWAFARCSDWALDLFKVGERTHVVDAALLAVVLALIVLVPTRLTRNRVVSLGWALVTTWTGVTPGDSISCVINVVVTRIAI